MTPMLKHALMFFLVVPVAVAQTAEQRVCDAVKDPNSPQCVLINGVPKTSPSMPKQPAPVVPTWTPPPTASSDGMKTMFQKAIDEQAAANPNQIRQQRSAQEQIEFQHRQAAADAAQRRLAAAQAERQAANDDAMSSIGYGMGYALGAGLARSIEMHRFHSYVKKRCRRYGSGTSWGWQFSNGQTAQGTCN